MRILIYGLNFTPEKVGIGKYTGEMFEWLQENNHLCDVVTAQPFFPNWKSDKKFYTFNKNIIRCPLWVPKKPSGIKRILHLLSFALTSFPIVFVSCLKKYDLIITISPTILTSLSIILIKFFLNKKTKTCLHIQDFEIDAAFNLNILKNKKLKFFLKKVELFILRKNDLLSTISNEMFLKMECKELNDSRKIVFPNWVDTKIIFPKRKEDNIIQDQIAKLGFKNSDKIIMYSGSMNAKQGINFLCEVIKETLKINNIKWVLSGQGHSKPKLEKEFYGNKNVKITDLKPIEELNNWLNMGDIHVIPQKIEVSGLVLPSKLLGIMAIGKPVVATAPKDSDLYLNCKNCGLLVEPSNLRGFSNAIIELSRDEEKAKKLGEAGLTNIIGKFDKETVLNDFNQEINDLVN